MEVNLPIILISFLSALTHKLRYLKINCMNVKESDIDWL